MSELDDLLDPNVKDSSTNYGGNSNLPNATATLVLGILSIVGCFLYGLPGLICGIIALFLHGKDKRMFTENPKRYEASFKNAKAGFICAIIGISLSVLYILIFLVFIGTVANNILRI